MWAGVGFGDLAADVRAIVRHGEDKRVQGTDPKADSQWTVVDAAAVTTDDECDSAVVEGIDGRERRQDVRRQAVVDEADPAHRPDHLQPAVQTGKTLRGGPQLVVVVRLGHTELPQTCLGNCRVAPVVEAEKPQRPGPVADCVVVGVHPSHPRAEEVPMGTDQVTVTVGDGQLGAGLRAGGQLVTVVRLGIAVVPRQMIGMQGGECDHRRGTRQVGRLVAGHLHDPEVVLGADPRIVRRHTDVARDQASVAEPGQQVPGNGRGRALALGSGHTQHLRPVGLGKPQAHTTHHRDAALFQAAHGRAVPRDPRRLDNELTAGEGVKSAGRGRQQRSALDVGTGGSVVDEHRVEPQGEAGPQVGFALAAQAVETDRAATQVRPGDRRAHTGPERSGGHAV